MPSLSSLSSPPLLLSFSPSLRSLRGVRPNPLRCTQLPIRNELCVKVRKDQSKPRAQFAASASALAFGFEVSLKDGDDGGVLVVDGHVQGIATLA